MEDKKRLQLIEVCLLWEGGVNANTLQKYFDISRTTAQRHIDDYKGYFPNNIAGYDNKAKVHVPSENFRLEITTGDLAEYLSFFGSHGNSIVVSTETTSSYIELLPTPTRNINPKLIRVIIKACKQKLRLDIGYYSVSSGATESRIISPHSIIFDGVRWHTRAWCERSQAFRDFVLSRFHDEPIIEDTAAMYTKKDDHDWMTVVNLEVQPDPRLNNAQKHAIELDYKMENGTLSIPVRGALVKYLIQKLRLDSYDPNPQGQQIIITPECWQAIEPYRMN